MTPERTRGSFLAHPMSVLFPVSCLNISKETGVPTTILGCGRGSRWIIPALGSSPPGLDWIRRKSLLCAQASIWVLCVTYSRGDKNKHLLSPDGEPMADQRIISGILMSFKPHTMKEWVALGAHISLNNICEHISI